MVEERSPLEKDIRRLIAVAGSISVAEYMRIALTHPQHGYYFARQPIGAKGDFITAPEISQMFGELIGLWMVAVWGQMGAPENVRLIELGPGRGTLMDDALRAAKIAPDFFAAIVVHLVEISPHLRELQQQRLEAFDLQILWHCAFADVPDGPSILVANEFIDSLPIRQVVKRSDGWHERLVQIGPNGEFVLGIADEPLPDFDATLPPELRGSAEGSVYEWRPAALALDLARRVRGGGAALIIDYGHSHHGLGDTLQAVAHHSFADPLRLPGFVDLTAHVDFLALAYRAELAGARVHGPLSQREFLHRLGIAERAAALKSGATADQAADIEAALSRLTATAPGGMGELFKVLAIGDPRLGPLPGFE